MKSIVLVTAFFFLILGCTEKKIEVTPDYIINPNWSEQANSIEITKINLKGDSSVTSLTTLGQQEILRKFEEDTSSVFVANVTYNGESYSKRKVFFNKINGFSWWTKRGESEVSSFGTLQRSQWYKISRLVTYPYDIYIYIDNTNHLYRYDVTLANY